MSPPTPPPPAVGWPFNLPVGAGAIQPAVASAAADLAAALSRYTGIPRVTPSIFVARERVYPTFPYVPVSTLVEMLPYLPAAVADGGGGGGGGALQVPLQQGPVDVAAGRLFDHWAQVHVGVAGGGLCPNAFLVAIWSAGLTLTPAMAAGHFKWTDVDADNVVSRTEFIAYVGRAWHQRASLGGWER